jgi:hypothetical protein
MDKDSYFIPTGYDSASVLKNFDIQNDLLLLYEERVPYVKPKNVIKEEEVVCEEVNAFLKRFVDKEKKLEEKSTKKVIPTTSVDYSMDPTSYNNNSLNETDLKQIRNSSTNKDDKENFGSIGKVNFDIWKDKNPNAIFGKSIDITSDKSKMTAEEKLVNIPYLIID